MTIISQRKSGTDLPSARELMEILKRESPRRAIRFDYLPKHDGIFASYRELAALAHQDASWIDNYPHQPLEVVVESISTTNQAIATYIHSHSAAGLYERVYASLVTVEDMTKSDAIFVFGAISNARIQRAVELYEAGVAPKLIVSGNRPFYSSSEESEAYRMSKYAIERGVPESAIILEDRSITIPDNVKRSIDLLESMSWRPTSVTLIAANFVLQRASMD